MSNYHYDDQSGCCNNSHNAYEKVQMNDKLQSAPNDLPPCLQRPIVRSVKDKMYYDVFVRGQQFPQLSENFQRNTQSCSRR